jgi:hypothetical protein
VSDFRAAEGRRSLSETFADLLSERKEDLTVGRVAEEVGDRGFGLLLAVLSLPSALPVPAPGYSTPFGIVLLLLGVQLLAARTRPWLPERANRARIKPATAERIFRGAGRFLNWVERLVHPRMRWIHRAPGRVLYGGAVCLMSLLMVLPIPLTNTLPAGVIFLLGVALSEEDGAVALAALALGLLATLFYAYLVYLLLTLGQAGVDRILTGGA